MHIYQGPFLVADKVLKTLKIQLIRFNFICNTLYQRRELLRIDLGTR